MSKKNESMTISNVRFGITEIRKRITNIRSSFYGLILLLWFDSNPKNLIQDHEFNPQNLKKKNPGFRNWYDRTNSKGSRLTEHGTRNVFCQYQFSPHGLNC